MLGKDMKLDQVLEVIGMAVEGVHTTKAAPQLATKYDVTMPITSALCEVLFNDIELKVLVESLMNRTKKSEIDEMS